MKTQKTAVKKSTKPAARRILIDLGEKKPLEVPHDLAPLVLEGAKTARVSVQSFLRVLFLLQLSPTVTAARKLAA